MPARYVVVRLDDPVGPRDAQDLASHIVGELAFAEVAWAQPAVFNNKTAEFTLLGERVRWSE